MPTITWGAIQSKKEHLVSGIEFFQRISLTIDDLNANPLLLPCFVRKNSIFVLYYLKKLGIPTKSLGDFTRRYLID
jgi:hypothetical protein